MDIVAVWLLESGGRESHTSSGSHSGRRKSISGQSIGFASVEDLSFWLLLLPLDS